MSWLMVSEALLDGVLALLSYANAEAENHHTGVLEYVCRRELTMWHL